MFYVQECVHSRYYGFGQVVDSGQQPMVAFLDGPTLMASAETLTIISSERYAMEVRNRFEIESWLSWRVTGQADTRPTP